ncbi:Fc receptor 6 [Pelobates cultripes]|uniref:Fc receptor 6 n=1 Tax=Pelobates cultripes TaxID=61616 RepID=A0AAD1TI99_PELCU|nr:Fc receptor 6 [Pelobates cultripes]
MFVLILTALLFVVLNNSRAEARPIISTKSDTGKIFTGESITLTCNMDSLSTHLWYNYNWYRDETKISKGRIYTINRATSEDSGDYTCTYKVITSYRSDPFTLKVSDDVFSDPELNMDPIQLTVGAPMTLTCATRLAPYKLGTELQVAFYRNGEKVQEFGKSNQYRVKSSKLYHSGDYTCEVRTATDSVRKISQKLNIKIEGTMARPVISLTPNWGKIFTGESVTLTCNVGFSEQDKQKYYWYKDKQKISKSEKTFKIQSAITDDSGFYQCQTRSSGFSDPITLDVRNNDFILQAPNSVYEGDYLKLECNKKTKYSDFSPRFYHRDKLLQSDSGSNFHLDNAETSDSGTYRCTYNYYYGDYYEDSANVTVQELFSIPHISVSPNPLTLGADTTLTCDTSLALLRADTELEFAFYRNGKMVQGFRTSNTYRIKILDWDLLGNYTCDAITSTRSVKKTSRRSNIKIAVMFLK